MPTKTAKATAAEANEARTPRTRRSHATRAANAAEATTAAATAATAAEVPQVPQVPDSAEDTEEITEEFNPDDMPLIPNPDDAVSFGTNPDDEDYGAAVLDEVEMFIRRFLVLPDEEDYGLMTLWAAHTHAIPVLTRSARAAFLGDEPGIGKTRALDLLALLCNNASVELDPTGPAFVQKIATESPTILLDETDTIWGKNGGSSGAMKTLRAILNSGYRRGATVTRKSGKETVKYGVFGPVAFAGMGTLPDTLMSRSLVWRLRRRLPTEKISTYMPRMHEPQGRAYGEALHDWVLTKMLMLANAWPDMPEGIEDRNSEIAESLLMIADAAGGDWPARARIALRRKLLEQKEEIGPTPAERVLRDIREVWPDDSPRVFTYELLERLFKLDDAPYATMWEPIAADRELASLLFVRHIAPMKVKIGGRALQGYKREHFAQAWIALDKQDAQKEADRIAAEEEAAEVKRSRKAEKGITK